MDREKGCDGVNNKRGLCFRLYCSTIVVEGDERSNPTNVETQFSLTVANAELVECLMELKDKRLEIVEVGEKTIKGRRIVNL